MILAFSRAFERYLHRRSQVYTTTPPKGGFRNENLEKYLKQGASRDYKKDLCKNLGVSVSNDVPFQYFLAVRIFQQVRHDIAHADNDRSQNRSDAEWCDKEIEEMCRHNQDRNKRPVFPKSSSEDERLDAIKEVCGGARKASSKAARAALYPGRRPNPDPPPLIFFYALFSLRAYRKLADAIECSFRPAGSP
ncbi:MAG: hypothetical protein ACP5NP_12420 [Acetobacteraceae bacterium]